jgi:hypothetical protein
MTANIDEIRKAFDQLSRQPDTQRTTITLAPAAKPITSLPPSQIYLS